MWFFTWHIGCRSLRCSGSVSLTNGIVIEGSTRVSIGEKVVEPFVKGTCVKSLPNNVQTTCSVVDDGRQRYDGIQKPNGREDPLANPSRKKPPI